MSRIYLVGDASYSFEKTQEALTEDITVFQLRLKKLSYDRLIEEAYRYQKVCRSRGILFVINDYLDVAIEIDADGLHIGQDDVAIKEARARFEKMIGVSARSVAEAKAAFEGGADYIGVGALFPTQTKAGAKVIGVEGLREIRERVKGEIVAIGGINAQNYHLALEAGADMVAISSAILGAASPREVIKSIKGGK